MIINTLSKTYTTQAPISTDRTSQPGVFNKSPSVAGDTVEISKEAYKALSDSDATISRGVALIVNSVNNDSEFADKMAYTYSHSRDAELIDLKDVPPLDDALRMDAYFQHVKDFESGADKIMNQRVQIYNAMKKNGANGADIFKSIMEFNKTLPADYQKNTGLDKFSKYIQAEA